MAEVRLTQFSHGAGCGCKISPLILDKILHSNEAIPDDKNLLVGNNTRDDASVVDLGNGFGLISTVDFFMPIVDDPFQFGRIAAANAISDVYAMGGKPISAIAILGWPINKLSADIAQKVVAGGRSVCHEAGIVISGGHSIDNPEPIFGLSVSGLVPVENLKRNNTAEVNNVLFLTKRLGVGILTTAEKRGLLLPEHVGLAAAQMTLLNSIGEQLGKMTAVKALTDVTGFGLLGHLCEMCEGSGVSAEINLKNVLTIADLQGYIDQDAVPGGCHRNHESVQHKVVPLTTWQKSVLCDPQTNGGLLISIAPEGVAELEALFVKLGLEPFLLPIGHVCPRFQDNILVRFEEA